MMREFIFVCSSVERIGRVICGSVKAYFLGWNWVFYLGLGFCCYLDFKNRSHMFLGHSMCRGVWASPRLSMV